MKGSTRLLIPRDTPGDPQVTLVGAKALQLWRIHRLGLCTPDWLVVTTAAMQLELAPWQARLDASLRRLQSMSDVPQVAGEVRDTLAAISLSAPFAHLLACDVYRQFGVCARLAVRSSAPDEDGPSHSFAGQYASYLNVTPDQVAARVIDVWRSAYSAGVLAYRIKKGLSPTPPHLAVILQTLVRARASGVMFTREPGDAKRRTVISAAYGLGEGVVANRADSDSYRLGWSAWWPERTIRAKRVCVEAESAGDGTATREVPQAHSLKSVLGRRDLARLQKAGARLEAAFGTPLDVEWCTDDKGRLYVLQARPLTRPLALSTPELRIWDNANIVESYPGITLPLTFSFIRANYEALFRSAACGLVLGKRRVAARADIWAHMLGLIHGRVYYNLGSWYRMLSLLPGFEEHRKAWDAMIGITHHTEVEAGRLPWYDRWAATARLVGCLISPGRLSRRFLRACRPLLRQNVTPDPPPQSDREVITQFRGWQRQAFAFWHWTLYIDFCAMKYFAWLKALCRRWGASDCTDLHTGLLSGMACTESARAVHSAVAIAEEIRGHQLQREMIAQLPPSEMWQRIATDESWCDLRTRCLAHLAQYGDRCSEELKLETVTPREQPAKLVALLADYVRSDLTVSGLLERERARREEARRRLLEAVRHPLKRAVLRLVLSRAIQAVTGREDCRFARTRLYGMARATFRHLGRRLVACGALAQPSDVHYLTVDEVFDWFEGDAATSDLAALARLRKAEYERFATEAPPARFETRESPAIGRWPASRSWNGSHRHLTGTGCSQGLVEGEAAVLKCPEGRLRSHQIIVAESTDPSWAFAMINAGGLVVERGSVLSHTAILGRELGIPTVVNAEGATHRIPERARIRVNGGTGEVAWK